LARDRLDVSFESERGRHHDHCGLRRRIGSNGVRL
jgi:hypothetical protein